ncbi:hypothetical protein GCM10022234_11630 [Aeromicrobium panaciterrae]|uniref:hypothetical protein n=1 Tax=Aeromicrobium panaciterrae TaxID=363861 RepID=UPI0031CE3B20
METVAERAEAILDKIAHNRLRNASGERVRGSELSTGSERVETQITDGPLAT